MFPPIKFGRIFSVDTSAKCVSVEAGRFLTWFAAASGSRTACWTGVRSGCRLLEDGETMNLTHHTDLMLHRSDKTSWPTEACQAGKAHSIDIEKLDAAVSQHFNDTRLHTRAFLVVKKGNVVYEKYAQGFGPQSRHLGWSATKSLLNALVGIRIQQGKLQLSSTLGELLPQVVPNGQVANVTVEDLLRMRDGFDFDELYKPGSGVTDILFGCCKRQ